MTAAIRRLLVPIDFSAGSQKAAEYAALLACALNASVHLLHVLEESFATSPWDFNAQETAARRERAVRETEAKLAAVAAGFAPIGAKVTYEVRSGRAAREITAVASERGTDLILMGAHGRTRLAHVVHGSVAEHVVRKAPCAVLAVCERGLDYTPTVLATAHAS